VCAYSLRIAERPTVSTPVSWREIEDAVESEDRDALTFEAPAVLERISTGEDHYEASLTEHQDLPSL
ncbi:MAG: bifunctional non-ous end joining protein LigD, partial [Actinomycetota bacterium]|jgi:bifunctional non-homologous end joining protein LigD|nr:bifunctional non-ous end joining protein LigD [Actinomycetota bacterium]